jgi:hypothetical protein
VVLIDSFKRGQTFLDIFIIAVIIFVSATAFIVVSMMQKEITTEMLSDPSIIASPEATLALSSFDASFTTMLDNLMLIVFVLFWVFIIVSSLFVDANPVFLMISFILLTIVLVVMGVMSNAYEEFISDGSVYTFAAGFPKTNYIMEHLVMFSTFIAFSGIIAIYGKNFFGGGGV